MQAQDGEAAPPPKVDAQPCPGDQSQSRLSHISPSQGWGCRGAQGPNVSVLGLSLGEPYGLGGPNRRGWGLPCADLAPEAGLEYQSVMT